MNVQNRIMRALCSVRWPRAAVGALALLGLILGHGTAGGRTRDAGEAQVTAHLRGIPVTVYTYHPPGCSAPTLLFVFHGLNRTASSYLRAAKPLANQKCMIVFAPLFDAERFPSWRYQRGGIVHDGRVLPREQWTAWMVSDLVTWVRLEEGRLNAPYYLFGHSAGAQFLSRAAAFTLPADAARIVIANPSTYVLPSVKEPAPYGLGGVFDPAKAEEQLKRYLALPITIYLGEDDTGEKDLAQSASAMRQGDTRLERGQSAFKMAQSIAQANGWDFRWRLVTASDVGHSAGGMLRAEEAIKAFEPSEPELAH
jgi:poly(3-hydroxybutyrate) depolymerase